MRAASRLAATLAAARDGGLGSAAKAPKLVVEKAPVLPARVVDSDRRAASSFAT